MNEDIHALRKLLLIVSGIIKYYWDSYYDKEKVFYLI